MKANYTIPKLSKSSDTWFVFFRYNGKLYQRKEQLNRIKDLVERERKFLILCDIYHDKLKEGWNPEYLDPINEQSKFTLIEALRFALDKKKPNISKKTYSGYNGSVNFLETAIVNIGLKELKVIDCKRVHVKMIMEKAKELNEWSNKAHNKHLNHFKAVLSELLQWDIIENSPAFKVDNLKVSAPDANKPASKDDMLKIRKELETNHYNFYVFCISIFFTGIRPEELLKIKLAMVNLKDSEIVLPPEITKTNKKRVVPISPFLLEYYKSLQFEKLPKDYYLFGSFKEAGKGNTGKNQFLKDFIPAPTHINRDTATRRWETIVKKGLGIQMSLYSMKKAGANALILAGVSINAIKDLFGHTSEVTTQIYITNLKEINRKEILEKGTDF
jgi:integrase